MAPLPKLSHATVPLMSVMKHINTFYNELSYLVRHTSKHNVLIISGDINAYIGKYENNTLSLHISTNRNDEYLAKISQEN